MLPNNPTPEQDADLLAKLNDATEQLKLWATWADGWMKQPDNQSRISMTADCASNAAVLAEAVIQLCVQLGARK